MAVLAAVLAGELLEAAVGGLLELRIHEFADDKRAHDNATIDKLYTEFAADFDRYVTTLSMYYGNPDRTGQEYDEVIPLSGVFRFAVWSVGDQHLFCAAAHEDRGAPILLNARDSRVMQGRTEDCRCGPGM